MTAQMENEIWRLQPFQQKKMRGVGLIIGGIILLLIGLAVTADGFTVASLGLGYGVVIAGVVFLVVGIGLIALWATRGRVKPSVYSYVLTTLRALVVEQQQDSAKTLGEVALRDVSGVTVANVQTKTITQTRGGVGTQYGASSTSLGTSNEVGDITIWAKGQPALKFLNLADPKGHMEEIKQAVANAQQPAF